MLGRIDNERYNSVFKRVECIGYTSAALDRLQMPLNVEHMGWWWGEHKRTDVCCKLINRLTTLEKEEGIVYNEKSL